MDDHIIFEQEGLIVEEGYIGGPHPSTMLLSIRQETGKSIAVAVDRHLFWTMVHVLTRPHPDPDSDRPTYYLVVAADNPVTSSYRVVAAYINEATAESEVDILNELYGTIANHSVVPVEPGDR